MGKRFALVAIRLMVSVNLLYAAIFAKFAGIPQSVALFTQMSQAVHGLIPQPVFRLGSGVFETTVAVLLLIPKTARLGARLVIVWMTAIILSHIFVLGYGVFLSPADAQAIPSRRTRKSGNDGCCTNAQKIVGRTDGSEATTS